MWYLRPTYKMFQYATIPNPVELALFTVMKMPHAVTEDASGKNYSRIRRSNRTTAARGPARGFERHGYLYLVPSPLSQDLARRKSSANWVEYSRDH